MTNIGSGKVDARVVFSARALFNISYMGTPRPSARIMSLSALFYCLRWKRLLTIKNNKTMKKLLF
ncbi:MAG: hypothetical protein J1E04_06015, partial [Alistipes sp.]|nr:hypothetical protein [Alistipes sp.]